MHDSARSLRTAERFLLAPPLAATFGTADVVICDISARGVRFRHEAPLQTGAKSILRIAVEPQVPHLDLETIVVWTQADTTTRGKFVSGSRTYGPPGAVDSLLAQLRVSKRTQRIEELRSTERFSVIPGLDGVLGDQPVTVEDLSARGARIATAAELVNGATSVLRFQLPDAQISVEVPAQVMWTGMKSIDASGAARYRAGLLIQQKPEMMRLAIGHLTEPGRAAIDAHSLGLKLKILHARARQLAPSYPQLATSGIPAEQYLLIQGVREELRLNPEEAMHWYRKARLLIADPATGRLAGPIATHPDALAVWEYLDRSVDPSILARAFDL